MKMNTSASLDGVSDFSLELAFRTYTENGTEARCTRSRVVVVQPLCESLEVCRHHLAGIWDAPVNAIWFFRWFFVQ